MKRLLTAFMAACLFLTAGCGAGTAPSAAEDVPAPSAAASSMDETASSRAADAASQTAGAPEGSGSADAGATIEIDDSQAPAASWETQTFTSGPFTFELPADWKEYGDMGSYTAMFFTDASVDIASQPSNVVVEIMPTEPQEGVDYADPAVQDSFFEYIEADYLPPRSPENVAYSIWNGAAGTAYVVSFDRNADDGRTARQTVYFLMGLRFPVIVYATDFGEGMTPPVDDIARRVAATFRIDENFSLPQA